MCVQPIPGSVKIVPSSPDTARITVEVRGNEDCAKIMGKVPRGGVPPVLAAAGSFWCDHCCAAVDNKRVLVGLPVPTSNESVVNSELMKYLGRHTNVYASMNRRCHSMHGVLRWAGVVLDVPDNKVTVDYEGAYTIVMLQGRTPQSVANALHAAIEVPGEEEGDVFSADVRRMDDKGSGGGGAGGGRFY